MPNYVQIQGQKILDDYIKKDADLIVNAIFDISTYTQPHRLQTKASEEYKEEELRKIFKQAKDVLLSAESEIDETINEVRKLILDAGSSENKKKFKESPLEQTLYLDELRLLIYCAQRFAADAIAKSESIRDSIHYDCIIFLNLNYVIDEEKGRGLGVGFRKKQQNYRLGTQSPRITTYNFLQNLDVHTYTMYNNKNKHYIEIHIENHYQLAQEDIKEFEYLNLNSKLVISGHGGYEAAAVETDGKDNDKDRKDIKITKLCSFIKNNIKNNQEKFDSYLNPLKISFLSCVSAGMDLDKITKTEDIDLAKTMAGQLLIGLKQEGIYAAIKARTTSVATVKTAIRSGPVASTDSHISTDRVKPKINRLLDGTPQKHRGIDFVPANIKTKKGIRSHDYTDKFGFQGRQQRMPGYKYLFKWDATGKMNVTDIADGNVVNPFFEIQKDRVIQYLYGAAYHVGDGIGMKHSASKRKEIIDIAYAIEKTSDVDELKTAVRAAGQNQAVNRHVAMIPSDKDTRTRKILDWILNHLTTNPDTLLPAPNWNQRKLGLNI